MAVRKASVATFERKSIFDRLSNALVSSSTQQLLIGGILTLALFAFEIFNFDTTRFALDNLLGHQKFLGLTWASILAVAFCAIDFAGLARMFTPEVGEEEPMAVWYLTGAWFLGATMNAVMTWWAVSLTLLSHPLGNEILGREQLLRYVPIFVAALVWITRILFIGSIAVAGDHLLNSNKQGTRQSQSKSSPNTNTRTYNRGKTNKSNNSTARTTRRTATSGASFSSQHTSSIEPVSFSAADTGHRPPIRDAAPKGPTYPSTPGKSMGSRPSRIQRRPGSSSINRPPTVMQARGRSKN